MVARIVSSHVVDVNRSCNGYLDGLIALRPLVATRVVALQYLVLERALGVVASSTLSNLNACIHERLILEVQEAALIRRLLGSSIVLNLAHLPSIAVASNGDTDAEADARASRLLGLGRRRHLASFLPIKVASDLSVEREHCTIEDLLIELINTQLNELPKLEDALGLLRSTSARPVRLTV